MARTVTPQNSAEVRVHEFVAEASELGLPPGCWPLTLHTTLGNGLKFISVGPSFNSEGEAVAITYKQANGCISLVVFND